MKSRKAGIVAVQLALLLVVLLLVLGSALGQPILLSYVETESMSPTLEPGDGFIAVPVQVDSSVRTGDVVVFRAEELHGGGLTTHRVVGETDRGYVTRGDANPFTDQDGSEPPVQDAQIVAQALQVGGEVVVIPELGTAVLAVQGAISAVQQRVAALLGSRALLGPQGLAYLFFGATMVYYVLGERRGENRERRSREASRNRETGTDVRLIAAGFALLLVAGATAAMVGPAGTQEYDVVSAEFESARPTVIPAGESSDVAYPVGNGGLVPVDVFLEPRSDGVTVEPGELSVGSRSAANATVTLSAPPETGYYRMFLTEHRYLAVLPTPVTRALYQLHPWAPVVVIDSLLGGLFYAVSIALVGTGRVRTRSRGRDISLSTRLKRALRDRNS